MSPEVVALIAAIATVITRELLAWYDRALRRRGEKRTRADDDENGQHTDIPRGGGSAL